MTVGGQVTYTFEEGFWVDQFRHKMTHQEMVEYLRKLGFDPHEVMSQMPQPGQDMVAPLKRRESDIQGGPLP